MLTSHSEPPKILLVGSGLTPRLLLLVLLGSYTKLLLPKLLALALQIVLNSESTCCS
jgi:hypothetical protein